MLLVPCVLVRPIAVVNGAMGAAAGSASVSGVGAAVAAAVGAAAGVSSVSGVGELTPAAWDPATVTSVTLSSGNLVAANTGTTSADQGAHVPTTGGKTSGKWYWEFTFTTIGGGGNLGAGIGTTASTYSNMGNTSTTGNMVFKSGNIWTNGGVSGSSLGTRANGDVIGVAVDLDNRKIWFKKVSGTPGNWNNSGSADPATNVGGFAIPSGTMIPFVTFGGTSGAANNTLTANFGATSFTGSTPSAFNVGWLI